jgi:hypothetical protein
LAFDSENGAGRVQLVAGIRWLAADSGPHTALGLLDERLRLYFFFFRLSRLDRRGQLVVAYVAS